MFQILLAEDNPGDVLLFREALKSRRVPCNITVAEDGQKAMALLGTAAGGETEFCPHLIVLDINLPKYNGDAVLTHVRRQPTLKSVPVIVLTSSPSPADRAAALELGANLYLQKSSDLRQLLDIGKIVEDVLRHGSHAGPYAAGGSGLPE
ncbi:MAG TPA: response regulator [Bryobacteraceae bacterium]|jgi:two-component system, chemotaxis family, response regulator Rcp1|nr:response regulator [Bryobacteraceae bacterium]